jgi:hypothetical protein
MVQPNGATAGWPILGWGFTYVTAKPDQESEREYRQYCQRKAKEHRAHRWVTIAQTPGPGGRIWMIERDVCRR